MRARRAGLAAALLAAAAWPAHAADGRLEINQAKVLAAGGFPYTISQPGSYLLTSDLVVPPGGSGILLQTDRVSLDLNGFGVLGTHVCQPAGACPSSDSFGIGIPPIAPFFGSRVTVVNGEVSGFGDNCVRLFEDARLERLVLRHCGANGAFVAGGSILIGNRVSNYGEFGLRMNGPVAFSDNVLAPAGYGATPGTAYSGGVSGGGNVCGGPCAPPPKRRFYLTNSTFDGANADNPGNCAPAFHFASLYEIHDPSALEYDNALGRNNDDSGEGPPTPSVGGTFSGWVRTGNYDNLGSPLTGVSNCFNWATASNSFWGSNVALIGSWDATATGEVHPWTGGTPTCDSLLPIWCVED